MSAPYSKDERLKRGLYAVPARPATLYRPTRNSAGMTYTANRSSHKLSREASSLSVKGDPGFALLGLGLFSNPQAMRLLPGSRSYPEAKAGEY